ncbi:MAG: hypothetical protein QGH90_06310, partial [Candidatus Poseidoniaceae archaeon]|nr:hypothetical protein [Candidatus Poseidoniaceae archaeon]
IRMVITITPTTIAKGFLVTVSAIFCKSIVSDYKFSRLSAPPAQRDDGKQLQERPWAHRGCSAGWI